MKKLIMVAITLLALILISCTGNQRARTFGGEEVVELPKK